MPLIFNEDRALKALLSGMVIPAANGTNLPVKVRFGLPPQEEPLTFPSIIIEQTDVARDPEREHRGWVLLPYAPEGKPKWFAPGAEYSADDSPYLTEFPVPLNIDYQVTVLAREKNHIMMLVGMLTAADRLPPRFGAVFIPQDGTERRVEVVGGPELESGYESDKRIFRAKYAVRIPTEVMPSSFPQIFRVNTVNVEPTMTSLYSDIAEPDPSFIT